MTDWQQLALAIAALTSGEQLRFLPFFWVLLGTSGCDGLDVVKRLVHIMCVFWDQQLPFSGCA